MSSENPPTTDSHPQPDRITDQRSNRNQVNRTTIKSIYSKKEFKGATLELAGFIFNFPSEQKKRGEYNEAIAQLKAYSAQHFPEST